MHVVVAPDKFAGTLTAVEAARAVQEGWWRRSPDDTVDLVPMADGGPGFVEVLHEALGGDLVAKTVPDSYGQDVPAAILVHGTTAYVETAQAVGLHLTPEEDRRPRRASSAGAGSLLLAAIGSGVEEVVIGLGGSAVNDGGAGMLSALGATSQGAPLDQGPDTLAGVTAVDVGPALEALAGVRLVAASDVDNPLLGLTGATKVYGPQKGLAEEELVEVDARLEELARACDLKTARAKGAGAAGGLGYALLLLGAERQPGLDVVAAAVGLDERLAQADLAITGEGSFDFSSRSGKVPYGVAKRAEAALVPCVALAGRVLVGSREMRALGVESAYSMVELVGEEAALGDPYASLVTLAERVARTWSRRAG